MNDIEKAIKYLEVRERCAGDFGFMCGFEECEFYETEYCPSERSIFMREGEVNKIALAALKEKLERGEGENDGD